MGHYRILHLTSVSELRSVSAAWDNLWWRSEATMPTLRAELLAQWLERFVSRRHFHAVVATTESGRWVAALPLVSQRLLKVIPTGSLPTNPWLPCGDLLLDIAAPAEPVLASLVSALTDLSWPLLWLSDTALGSNRWNAFLSVCKVKGVPTVHRTRFQVAKMLLAPSWTEFEKNLPRSHRQNMRRTERNLSKEGQLRLELFSQLSTDEVNDRLRTVFTVEDSSWKGAAGSSVLRTPGMSDFYLRQARQLAAWGQLEIALLRLDEHPIATLFGFSAKGVLHAHKIGYDPRFSQFGPGQMLFWKLLEQMHSDASWRALDCIGPLSKAAARWHPNTYTVGRIVAAPRKKTGRLLLEAYERFWPMVSSIRNQYLHNPALEPVDPSLPEPVGAM